MRSRIAFVSCAWVVGAILLVPTGCKRAPEASTATGETSSSGATGATGGAGGAQVSGVQREAQDAALAEIGRHWVKGPDGWTTARISGSAYAPDRYLRQVRDLTVDGVDSFEIGDADRLNGFEWIGQINFKPTPCREAGDPGIALEGLADITVMRRRGAWTQWIQFHPESLHLQKVKGHWQIPQDTWLLRGNLPTPADYGQAGVH